MLRYAFLKSDFHPQLLILGARDDFEVFASLLRNFAKNPRSLSVPKAAGTAPETDANLTICAVENPVGVRMPSDGSSFEWKLSTEWAAFFADLVEKVARSDAEAVSEILEIGGDLNEIPVKVSRGEFTDDFLTLES